MYSTKSFFHVGNVRKTYISNNRKKIETSDYDKIFIKRMYTNYNVRTIYLFNDFISLQSLVSVI